MTPRLLIGIALFVTGAVVWRLATRRALQGPLWLPRLGLGVAALGLGTLSLTQPGLWWSIASILFGAIAVGLLGAIVLQNLRR